jgi:hypothetical protein
LEIIPHKDPKQLQRFVVCGEVDYDRIFAWVVDITNAAEPTAFVFERQEDAALAGHFERSNATCLRGCSSA